MAPQSIHHKFTSIAVDASYMVLCFFGSGIPKSEGSSVQWLEWHIAARIIRYPDILVNRGCNRYIRCIWVSERKAVCDAI